MCVGGGRAEACGSHVGGTTHAEWEVYLIGCGEEEGQFWLNEEPVLGHRVGGGAGVGQVCVCVCVCVHARTHVCFNHHYGLVMIQIHQTYGVLIFWLILAVFCVRPL